MKQDADPQTQVKLCVSDSSWWSIMRKVWLIE